MKFHDQIRPFKGKDVIITVYTDAVDELTKEEEGA
jgi:hypothetical protein